MATASKITAALRGIPCSEVVVVVVVIVMGRLGGAVVVAVKNRWRRFLFTPYLAFFLQIIAALSVSFFLPLAQAG